MPLDIEAQLDEFERIGIHTGKPLWLQYQHAIRDKEKDITECEDQKEIQKIRKQIDGIKKLFLDIYHTKLGDTYPHLLYEIGEDSTYWMYNDQTGVYEEMNVVSVRSIVLKMVMRDGITPTVAWVRECLARYRAEYQTRAHNYSDFDSTDYMVHVKNGWLDILTKELTPHTHERLSLGTMNVVYDPNAQCQNYDALFNQWEFSEDKIAVLHEFSGYLLTPEVNRTKMLVLEGEPGTGKSLLANVWTHMLHDYAVREYSLETFTENPRFCMSAFVGKRCVWFNETDPKRSLLGSTMQKMIDGRTFTVERKGINGKSEHKNISKSILCTNGLPANMHIGMESRIIYIQYTKVFRNNDEEIRNLDEILLKESSGILNRMLEGLHRLNTQGTFTKIKNQDEIMDEYRRTISLPIEFIEVYFDPVEDMSRETFLSNKKLNEAFRMYVHDRPGYYDSPEKFSKEVLKNMPRKFKKTVKAMKYQGVRGMIGMKLQKNCIWEGNTIKDQRLLSAVDPSSPYKYDSNGNRCVEAQDVDFY